MTHILHWYLRPFEEGLWCPLIFPGPLDNGWGTTNPAELGGDEEVDEAELLDRGAPYKWGKLGDDWSTIVKKVSN